MLYVQSMIKIVDNSGGFLALCIRVLRSSTKIARPGDLVVLAVKSILINHKLRLLQTTKKRTPILKGSVHRAVVIRTSEIRWRTGRVRLQLTSNCVVLLGRWDTPLMNRAKGPAMFEIKITKYKKFTNITEGLI